MDQVWDAGQVIVNQGPWAAFAFILFMMFVYATNWYVKTQKKTHEKNLEQMLSLKDSEMKAVAEATEKVVVLVENMSVERQTIQTELTQIKSELEKVLKVAKKGYLTVKGKECPTCCLADPEKRQNLIRDIKDEIT